MALLRWLIPPDSSAVLAIHVTGRANLARAVTLRPLVPPGVGYVAIPPPPLAPDLATMTAWVDAQVAELLATVPDPRLHLVGYSMAGHVATHLARTLLARDHRVDGLTCLETLPARCYLKLPIGRLLDLPGTLNDYGRFGARLRRLDTDRHAGRCDVETFGARLAEIVEEDRGELFAGLIALNQANAGTVEFVGDLYRRWANFVRISLTAPEAGYPAVRLDLMTEGTEPCRRCLRSEARSVRDLPGRHGDLIATLRTDGPFWAGVEQLTAPVTVRSA